MAAGAGRMQFGAAIGRTLLEGLEGTVRSDTSVSESAGCKNG
jgi:hypothetical protein